MVVDDEPLMTQFIVHVLALNGYQVVSSSNTNEVFTHVHQHEVPDLVVTDVVMPGMDGRELGHWMQAAYPKTKILFISGHPQDELADSKVLGTNAAFLQKPFLAKQLIKAIRDLLGD